MGMSIKEIRKQRLAELTANRGDKARLSREADLSASQISQWLSGERNMSEDTAREIERARDLPVGWMDSATMNSSPLESEGIHKHENIQSYEFWRGEVETEIRVMSVSTEWLKAEGYTKNQIKSIVMPDDSQVGLVNRGYEVAINTDWGGELINDLYYAIKIGGLVTIRRVEYTYSGDVMLRCLNSEYAEQTVSKSDVVNLDIAGVAVRFQGNFPKSK